MTLLHNFFQALGFEEVTIHSAMEEIDEPEEFIPAPSIENP